MLSLGSHSFCTVATFFSRFTFAVMGTIMRREQKYLGTIFLFVRIVYIAWIRQNQAKALQLISKYSTIIMNHSEVIIIVLNH